MKRRASTKSELTPDSKKNISSAPAPPTKLPMPPADISEVAMDVELVQVSVLGEVRVASESPARSSSPSNHSNKVYSNKAADLEYLLQKDTETQAELAEKGHCRAKRRSPTTMESIKSSIDSTSAFSPSICKSSMKQYGIKIYCNIMLG